jgi:hypothetical protein
LGIDADGNIVGFAIGPASGGRDHAFLWHPVTVPEPGTLTLLGIGLAVLGAAWSRQGFGKGKDKEPESLFR